MRAGALLIAIAIAVGATASALAYWRGNGSGSATTALANVQSLSLEPATPSTQLYPGGSGGVSIVVLNPNPFRMNVGSMILDPNSPEPFSVDAAHSACDLSVLSFDAQSNGGVGWQIPPAAGSTLGRLAIEMPAAMKMSTAAASACQGASFTVQLEATP